MFELFARGWEMSQRWWVDILVSLPCIRHSDSLEMKGQTTITIMTRRGKEHFFFKSIKLSHLGYKTPRSTQGTLLVMTGRK